MSRVRGGASSARRSLFALVASLGFMAASAAASDLAAPIQPPAPPPWNSELPAVPVEFRFVYPAADAPGSTLELDVVATATADTGEIQIELELPPEIQPLDPLPTWRGILATGSVVTLHLRVLVPPDSRELVAVAKREVEGGRLVALGKTSLGPAPSEAPAPVVRVDALGTKCVELPADSGTP